jgi:hypothetical protein
MRLVGLGNTRILTNNAQKSPWTFVMYYTKYDV